MSPLVVSVALKLEILFVAVFKVIPVAAFACAVVVLRTPVPLSVIDPVVAVSVAVPVVVRLPPVPMLIPLPAEIFNAALPELIADPMLILFAEPVVVKPIIPFVLEIAPVVDNAPAELEIVIVPEVVSPTVPTESPVADASTKVILPVALEPVKLVIALPVPNKFIPVEEDVVNSPLVILIDEASVIAPVAVKFNAFAAAFAVPLIAILPVVLVMDTAPVPVWLMPVTDKFAVESFKVITPVPELVPLKLVTVLVFPNVVPVAELVVSNPPEIKPTPASLILPASPFKLMPPVVDSPPALKIRLVPAVKVTAPLPLLTDEFTFIFPVPAASTTLTLFAPVDDTPTAVPKSSVKLLIVTLLFAARLIAIGPEILFVAIVLKALPVLVRVRLLASRKIKFVPLPETSMAPDCVMAPPLSKVTIPVK
jgi:hypothetical protein